MQNRRPIAIILAILISLLVSGCSATQKLTPSGPQAAMDPAKAEYFASAQWLKDHLNQVVVLDARGEKDYVKGHIPGALNTPWQMFAQMQGQPGDTGWGTLLSRQELAEKLGSLGIDGKKEIVVYADPKGWGEDGRIVWMLRMAGLKETKMLDGGWEVWKAQNNPVNSDSAKPDPVRFNILTWNENFNATTDWILSHQKDIKIVDSRSPKEYQGATDYGEARGGHLPQAVLIPFADVFNPDGTVKNSEELRKLFTAAGLKPDDDIVTYCTAGIRSAHMALLLEMTGFGKARNYDASFYEWAGMSSLPLEK